MKSILPRRYLGCVGLIHTFVSCHNCPTPLILPSICPHNFQKVVENLVNERQLNSKRQSTWRVLWTAVTQQHMLCHMSILCPFPPHQPRQLAATTSIRTTGCIRACNIIGFTHESSPRQIAFSKYPNLSVLIVAMIQLSMKSRAEMLTILKWFEGRRYGLRAGHVYLSATTATTVVSVPSTE